MVIEAQSATLVEWDYLSEKELKEPFNIELWVVITSPQEQVYRVPAFYRGQNRWSVRFLPKEAGRYKLFTQCKEPSLDAIEGVLEVSQSNKSYPKVLAVAANRDYLVDSEGEPFFWLSDTWWMALSGRLDFETFTKLATKRKEQGFSVIQLVAGLFPDMDSFDPRGANSGGFAWSDGYASINPAFFDEADKKILYLLNEGFTLCIVGSWGYYLSKMGLKRMQQHWRYIIARWGAYPIIWCLAGEATMPYYLSENRAKEEQELRKGWQEMAHYVRAIDPYNNLLTLHPMEASSKEIDASLIDINLLQASHQGYGSVSKGVALLQEAKKSASIPAIMDEINYEGILRDTGEAVQRLGFWSALLSGSRGFGYGANGIWQINKEQEPYGASPSGANWGNTPLKRAINFAGAAQIAKAKEFLEGFAWHNLEPMQERIEPALDSSDPRVARVAGIGQELRIAYLYTPIAPWDREYIFTQLEANALYECYFWDPQNFITYPKQYLRANAQGKLQMPLPPSLDDWVFIMQKSKKNLEEIEVSPLHKNYKARLKRKVKELLRFFR